MYVYVCVCVCVCVCVLVGVGVCLWCVGVVWGLSMRECKSSGSLCPHYSCEVTQASMQAL